MLVPPFGFPLRTWTYLHLHTKESSPPPPPPPPSEARSRGCFNVSFSDFQARYVLHGMGPLPVVSRFCDRRTELYFITAAPEVKPRYPHPPRLSRFWGWGPFELSREI